MIRTVTIFGVQISLMREADLLNRIRTFVNGPIPRRIVTVNPEFLVEAYRNPQYRELLQTADLATADGTGIIFTARLRGIRTSLRDRMTGVKLTHHLLALAQQKRRAVALILKSAGLSSPDELSRALDKRYPELRYTIWSEHDSFPTIATSKPEILFAALGSPRQDFYVRAALAGIPGLRIGLGVGGTFDYISGRMKRAPMLLRRLGLEWFWRLLKQPGRFTRIVRAVIVFTYLMLRYP